MEIYQIWKNRLVFLSAQKVLKTCETPGFIRDFHVPRTCYKKYYFIIAADETSEAKCIFMEREYQPYLDKGKSLPEKNSIAIITGRKGDGTVFVHDMSVLDQRIYMKLSDLK